MQCAGYLFLYVAYVGSLLQRTDEIHFPLDNSLCQVETTCQLVCLDNLDAVPCQLMRCIFDSKTLRFKLGQLVHFTNCEKYFLLVSCRQYWT